MTINERQIYYALDKITNLAGKGVTVSLSVKNDGSFDMTVNPHLLGMIDEDEDEDEESLYCELTEYLRKPADFYVGLRKNVHKLMKEIQDYGILINPHILKMIMEENQDKDDKK